MADEKDAELAAFAAAFLSNYREAEAGAVAPPSSPAPAATASACPNLSAEAAALLAAVDRGGVPAFMTTSLRRIAEDNGLKVSPGETPNDLIAALRRKAAP